jgi:sulfite reductase beta subunit-like hemoprotein
MIRTRTPGGVVTPTQWLQLDAIATTYAERGLRITTRQAFQFHGVIKRELKATMQAINAALIDTLAACGDVNRNVAVAANPLLSGGACAGARAGRGGVEAPAAEHPRLLRVLAGRGTRRRQRRRRRTDLRRRPTCRASSRSASRCRR